MYIYVCIFIALHILINVYQQMVCIKHVATIFNMKQNTKIVNMKIKKGNALGM